MPKPNERSRLQLAKLLSQHLSSFGKCFQGVILCPACIKPLDIKDDFKSLTAGHIIPDSAGGTEWTLLCNSCNSKFGHMQDNWFSEYLCVLKNSEGTFFHAKTKSKYITVNGVTISGMIDVSEIDGAVEVFLPINLNPPGKVDSIPRSDTLTVQFSPELVKHVNEIQIGYITAAYLTWFNKAGYNWAMQSNQESVRKQISECNYELNGAKVIDLQSDKLHEPTIGVIIESGYVYPCCLMYDKIVIFPPPSLSNAPSLQDISFNDTYSIHLLDLQIMSLPYSVNFDDGIVMMPDMLRKDPPIPQHMLYINTNKKDEWLTLRE